ncbi:MAG TPA: hypothetical protein VFJ61_00980 [Solirubrobacterales bacterium]|nr:hypothetical protein [Solirubrobacterales bacterium]
MSITTYRPTTNEVQRKYEVEGGTSIGHESPRLKERLRELESLLTDGSRVTLLRGWEGTAYALIAGDERFDSLCFLDDGRVGYGSVNLPAFYPTVAEYLEAGGV